ncbi:MAG: hypothetical protein JOZ42_04605, partial [Acetobacteraceae bacterium]|nr:hypothetical protein [Acetobacteraceae bacterium]
MSPTDKPCIPAEPDALLTARLVERLAASPSSLLMVTRSEDRASRLHAAASALAPALAVHLLPGWDCLAYDRVSPSRGIMGARMDVLHRAAQPGGGKLLLLGSVDSVTQRLPPPGAWRELTVRVGEPVEPDAVTRQLAALGYTIEDRVDEPGDAAIHGSVIDVFPPTSAAPFRIDHADGAVTDIRPFDSVTQRSRDERVEAVTLGPASEAVLDETTAERPDGGMEHVLLTLYPGLVTIFEAIPDAEIVLDPEVEALAGQHEADVRDAFRTATATAEEGADAAGSPWAFYLDRDAWEAALAERRVIRLAPEPDADASRLPRFKGAADFVRFVRQRADAGDRIGMMGPERYRRGLLRLLSLADAPRLSGWLELLQAEAGTVARLDGSLAAGFQTEGAVVVAPADVLGARARHHKAGTTAGFETAMAPGDAVIHLDHGLGVLRGVETVTAADVATDCLQLAYAG